MRDLLTYIPRKYRKSVIDFYKDDDGYWLTLDIYGKYRLSGYYSEFCIHEDTISDVLAVLRENAVLSREVCYGNI